jgi:hypothetical protein
MSTQLKVKKRVSFKDEVQKENANYDSTTTNTNNKVLSRIYVSLCILYEDSILFNDLSYLKIISELRDRNICNVKIEFEVDNYDVFSKQLIDLKYTATNVNSSNNNYNSSNNSSSIWNFQIEEEITHELCASLFRLAFIYNMDSSIELCVHHIISNMVTERKFVPPKNLVETRYDLVCNGLDLGDQVSPNILHVLLDVLQNIVDCTKEKSKVIEYTESNDKYIIVRYKRKEIKLKKDTIAFIVVSKNKEIEGKLFHVKIKNKKQLEFS